MFLQLFNLGLISNTVPLVFGFFWAGLGQVIVGIIDGKRGDIFGLAAFVSYGLFWMALSLYFMLTWAGLVPADAPGLGWMCIMFAILSGLLFIGTFKMTLVHVGVFSTVTVLFILLAGHFIGGWSPKIAGVEGMVCGALAAYGGVAIALNAKYGKTIFPMGAFKA